MLKPKNSLASGWLLASLLCACCASNLAWGADPPKIKFDKIIQDLGRTVEGESLGGRFYFTNTGASVLEVQQPETSCGCTVASVKPEKLQPGEKGEISFTLDLTNVRGPTEKSITVPSNDPQTPYALLIIKAEVTPVFEFSPELLFFGEVLPGKGAKGEIQIKRLDGKKLRITKTQTRDSFSVKVEPDEKSHGQSARLLVEAKPEGKPGAFTDMLLIYMDDSEKPILIIPLAGQLLGGIKVDPEVLVWDIPNPEHWPGPNPDATTVRRLVVSSVQEGKTFELKDFASDLEDLLVKIAAVEEGKKYQVLLKLDQPHKESAQALLTFETSLPTQPRLEIPIKINVAKP